MTVDANDIKVIVLEMVEQDIVDGNIAADAIKRWLEREGIEVEAMAFLIEKMGLSMVVSRMEGGLTTSQALDAALGTAFQIGWEACKYADAKAEDETIRKLFPDTTKGGPMSETPETPEPETPEPEDPPEPEAS